MPTYFRNAKREYKNCLTIEKHQLQLQQNRQKRTLASIYTFLSTESERDENFIDKAALENDTGAFVQTPYKTKPIVNTNWITFLQ